MAKVKAANAANASNASKPPPGPKKAAQKKPDLQYPREILTLAQFQARYPREYVRLRNAAERAHVQLPATLMIRRWVIGGSPNHDFSVDGSTDRFPFKTKVQLCNHLANV